MLPRLDKTFIAEHPKALLGYSDVTSLQVWLAREVGLVSFYAPMVASDFSKDVGPDMRSWECALGGEEAWSVGAEEGLRVLRRGKAEGVLSGGCLSIYAEALGTPYAARAAGGVLFLEDIGTKAYQWDRMLLHLRYAGMLEGVRGIVFGDMKECGADEEIEAAILHALEDFEGPIGIGLRSGHVDGGNVTLPLGVRVRVEFEERGSPSLRFLEGAVEI